MSDQFITNLYVVGGVLLLCLIVSQSLKAARRSSERAPVNEEYHTNLEYLKSIELKPNLDDHSLNQQLKEFVGKKIERVFYINFNYIYYEFEDFDSLDYGIVIQFEGEKYLNWLFHAGFEGASEQKPSGYYLDFSKHMAGLQIGELFFDVSQDKKWNKIVGSMLEDLTVDRMETEEGKICDKLIITLEGNKKVGIFSTEEPNRQNENSIEASLDFAPDWITVVFNQEFL